MQFGIGLAAHINDWQMIQYLEDLGYDSASVGDSQMIWSDCYATLALAAQNTKRIRIGTGVAIAATRLAPVTAHSIASIARLAPGRVFLGIGTGHTAMRVMGMRTMRVKAFRDYLRVVRGLLNGEEVQYTHDGETRAVRFLHRELEFLNLDDPIPIIVAANGPLALKSAGAQGDGWISGTKPSPEAFERDFDQVKAGAEATGRTLDERFTTNGIVGAVVLKSGEKVNSERVIDSCGSQVGCVLHLFYELVQETGIEEMVPAGFRGIWEEYCSIVDKMETPKEKRYLEIHNGHCTFLPEPERRLMTAEVIREVCLVAEADEIIEQIRNTEAAGLTALTVWPPMATAREVAKDFYEQVVKRY
jgi:alkanesulfonate monooxygenase SsuD/methylene tetrahydromethanopterin reductase-like flavin-dependent oxidoreductase (luciferase family)